MEEKAVVSKNKFYEDNSSNIRYLSYLCLLSKKNICDFLDVKIKNTFNKKDLSLFKEIVIGTILRKKTLDFLINNVNPRLGFRDVDKIALASTQNSITVLILNSTQLNWEYIKTIL